MDRDGDGHEGEDWSIVGRSVVGRRSLWDSCFIGMDVGFLLLVELLFGRQRNMGRVFIVPWSK